MQKYFGQILEMRQQNNSSISDQQEIINKFSVAKARKLIVNVRVEQLANRVQENILDFPCSVSKWLIALSYNAFNWITLHCQGWVLMLILVLL